MKKLLIAFGILTASSLQAQEFTYKSMPLNTPVTKTMSFSSIEVDYEPQLTLLKSAAPAPAGSVKALKLMLDAKRSSFNHQQQAAPLNKTAAATPQIVKGFMANGPQGTPNDNDVAMAKNGTIVSVVNSNVAMYNDTGRFIINRSLAGIARSLGTLNRTYDPRVIYDPIEDRFVLVFLQGTTSADTRIITGFSKTNNPNGEWNFYAIPGNVFGDSSWSDYPIISLSDGELFITVNRLKDNSSWQTGFIESLIWQVNKFDGYNGDTLRKKIYYDIRYNNKPIWSICPVKGSNSLNGPNMYFLSVRPSDLQNDTVFLHEISGNLSNNPTISLKVLKTNVAYGLQPNAPQPNGQYLQTNDARVLSACMHDNQIHYTANTIDPTLFAPSVYYGKVDLGDKNNPIIKGKIISYDSMDIGYPSIAYAGSGFKTDQSMMITFSHVSTTKQPGNSVVYVDKDGSISAPVHLKTGEGSVNILLDTIERWGDYTGNQTVYHKTGEVVISNSFGTQSGGHVTWVSRVKSTDARVGVTEKNAAQAQDIKVYPVPTSAYTHVEFELHKSMPLTFSLTDIQGKFNEVILMDKGKAGLNQFTFNTRDLPNGIYVLNIVSDEKVIVSKRIVVAH